MPKNTDTCECVIVWGTRQQWVDTLTGVPLTGVQQVFKQVCLRVLVGQKHTQKHRKQIGGEWSCTCINVKDAEDTWADHRLKGERREEKRRGEKRREEKKRKRKRRREGGMII